MKEIKCEVIQDLLPLYEDNAASEETQELVRAHLKDCSACREELRKMRVPISMPPDDDEEAVKRFLAHRAEVRRKQNVKIIRVVSVLAVLIVFCLCYTLIPRSWDSVAGKVEPDQIMGHYSAIIYGGRDGIADINVWQMNEEQEKDTAVINAIMETLRAGSYRAELRNVMNHTPFASLSQNTLVQGHSGLLFLYLLKDNEIIATVQFYGTQDHKVHIYTAKNTNTFFYHTDGKTFDALTRLIQEYGEEK